MSQNENSNLKRGIKTQLKVIENLPKSENRSREDSVTNKDKMNVNYKSDKNKNKIHWQIATSRSKYVHSSKVESNTFERNRTFNDIHFELSKMFSLLYNDDQNLTTKRPTSTIPSMPEKIPADSRNTSLHVTSTVQNKRPLVCTTKNYLKRLVSI